MRKFAFFYSSASILLRRGKISISFECLWWPDDG